MRHGFRLAFIFIAFAVLGGAATALWKHLHRPGLEDYRAHRYPENDPGGDALRASWFGTTAVLLSDGEQAILVDPFFSRPPGWWRLISNRQIAPDEALVSQWLGKAGVRDLLAVLVSHSHYDHAMDSAVTARLTGATLVGSPSTANIGRGGRLPESRLRIAQVGEPMRFGAFTITYIASRHAGATGGRPTGDIEEPLQPPARYLDYRQGGTYSIHVEHPLGSVLLHGSAGFIKDALRGRRADVVFLGVALVDDWSDYLAEVVDAVGASRVLPTHWDDFTQPLSQPSRPSIVGVDLPGFFQAMQARPAVRTLTLDVGRQVVLFPPPPVNN